MRNLIVKFMLMLLPLCAVAGGSQTEKSMVVAKVEKNLKTSKIEKILDKSAKQKIEVINWEKFPYCPKVEFAMAHDGDHIYIKYYVEEECTMAVQGEDFGRIWTDSCCEMFIMFDGEHYYNFEFNSIGRGLASRKPDGKPGINVDKELLSKIERYTTMGTETFEEIKGDNKWTLMLAIPVEIFAQDGITSFDGATARANFYKCGDDMSQPHFVTWSPIEAPAPSFHLPKWFKEIKFE